MFVFFNVDFLWGFCLIGFGSSGVCEEEWLWRNGGGLFLFFSEKRNTFLFSLVTKEQAIKA